LTFGEVVSDDTSFHNFYPRFANVLFPSVQFGCMMPEDPERVEGNCQQSGKRDPLGVCGWICGSGLCLPSMSAALVSSTGMVNLRSRRSAEEPRRLEAGSTRGYRDRQRGEGQV